MFKKSLRTIFALALFVPFAGNPASAVTFDFVSMADNPGDPNTIGGTEVEWQTVFPGGLTIGGITLDASGSNSSGASADAFFDKGTAGLGVCSTPAVGGGSGCRSGGGSGTNTGDDNVSASQGGIETLTLDFSNTAGVSTVKLNDILFRDSIHNLIGNGFVNINGDLLSITDGLLDGLATLTAALVYNFTYDAASSTEFYISFVDVSGQQDTPPPVPLPASVYLFGTGLLGIGFLARRRRKKNQGALKFT